MRSCRLISNLLNNDLDITFNRLKYYQGVEPNTNILLGNQYGLYIVFYRSGNTPPVTGIDLLVFDSDGNHAIYLKDSSNPSLSYWVLEGNFYATNRRNILLGVSRTILVM